MAPPTVVAVAGPRRGDQQDRSRLADAAHHRAADRSGRQRPGRGHPGQIIVAAEITVDSPGFGHLERVLDAARRELEAAEVIDRPGVVVADAGYWRKEQIESIVSDGIAVLVPPDGSVRKGIRPGWDRGMPAFMRSVLASEHGCAIDKHRKQTVEPVFAQIKFNRFYRRGRAAALSEWRLVAATHNLLKLRGHWIAAETG
jgi:hypothetical protein